MTATKARPLTSRQRQVLLWLAEYQFLNHCPPTLREVGQAHGLYTTNGPASLLRPLVRKGWLEFVPKVARGHRLAPWLLTMPTQQALDTIRTAEVADRQQQEPTR